MRMMIGLWVEGGEERIDSCPSRLYHLQRMDSNPVQSTFPNPVESLLTSQASQSNPQQSITSSSHLQHDSLPHIKLHIPTKAVPLELHAGLREIADNSLKSEINFCTKQNHGWMEAAGNVSQKGKGARGEWWWNLE